MPNNGFILGLLSVLLGFLGQLAWKKAVNARSSEIGLTWLFSLLTDRLVLLGLALYAASTLVWLVALRLEELSRLYTILSLNFALMLVAGYYLFGEKITLAKTVGVAMIIAGLLLVTLGGKS